MRIQVDAEALHGALKNVSLFTVNGSASGGVVQVTVALGEIELTSSDNYVAVRSIVKMDTPDGLRGILTYLDRKEIVELERTFRGAKGPVEFELPERSECPSEPYWDMLNDILGEVFEDAAVHPMDVLHGFSVDPSRLQKMNLLEPRGEYPLSLRHAHVADADFVVWKYGPATRGVIAPLNMEALYDAYPDNIQDVIW